MNGARKFGKTNVLDPAINVIEMMSISRHWDVPTNVIETAALWEFKKAANKLRNEGMCFKNVLNRLHGYFKSQVSVFYGNISDSSSRNSFTFMVNFYGYKFYKLIHFFNRVVLTSCWPTVTY